MLVAPKLRICRSESIPRQLHRCVRSFKRQDPRLVLTPWSNSEHFRCCPRTCRPLRDTLGALRWHKAGEHAPMSDMRRRAFITLLGGAAAAWPLAAGAQQALPVVGFLSPGSPGALGHLVAAFRRGLNETGYFEHRNVGIEYLWAEGQNDRLPALADALVRARVAVICGAGARAAQAVEGARAASPL